MYAQLSSIIASLFIQGIFGAKIALGLFGTRDAVQLVGTARPQAARYEPRALAALISAQYASSAPSEGALLTGSWEIAGSLAIFLAPWGCETERVGCVLAPPVAALVASASDIRSTIYSTRSFYQSANCRLTGRTVLWSRAASIISNLHLGRRRLQHFVVEGNPEAIRFWEMFYIYGHGGFHFHDLWLEMGGHWD